jgi:DNA-binding beta-propeller fold protein YncE
MYGDIGRGDWTQDEINYFKTKEYIGNYKYYSIYTIRLYPPYIDIGMTDNEFFGYETSIDKRLSKIIVTGKIAEEDEFRYLSLLRNEMYARNGYIFKDAGLKAFFNQMPWYKPISEDVQLNGFERTNLRTIKKIEKEVREIVELKEINPDTFPEKYTGKIIIDAKWGDEKGEYKLYNEGPGSGPETFAVDRNGNIYIIDLNHGEIKKYSKNGKLISEYKNEAFYGSEDIAIDSAGYIYVIARDMHNNALYHEILKYDQKTRKGESFWYAGADQKVNILSFRTKILQNRILVMKDDNVILDTKEFYKRGERSISRVNIDSMEVKKGGLVRISNAIDKSREVSIKVPKIFNKMCEPIGVGKGDYAIYYTYLGRDKKGNIFINCLYDIMPEFRDSNIYHNTKSVVYKYNSSSKLMSVIEIPQLEFSYGYMGAFRTIKVDRDGNVYFLRPDKNGLKIYKYEMR